MRVADRPGGVWTMQRIPGRRSSRSSPVRRDGYNRAIATGRTRCLRHAASNGPDASVRPGKSPARLDRPYTCEIPDGSRPNRDAGPRVALRSTSLPLEAPGLGADDAFVGAGE